jgi:hypothetical protein
LSFTPVTVTVCGVFQLLSVKVNDGVTVATLVLGTLSAIISKQFWCNLKPDMFRSMVFEERKQHGEI